MSDSTSADSKRGDSQTVWIEDGTAVVLGQLAILLAVAVGVTIWANASGFFNKEAVWLSVMLLLAGGMRLSGVAARRELARRRESEREAQAKESFQQQILEDCEQRRIRREAIRAGEISDDGLTDWGRNLAENTELAEHVRSLEEKYGRFGLPQTEKIFELEKEDKKIETAWKKKLAADAAWEKLVLK